MKMTKKITKEQEALLALAYAQMGRLGGKARWEGKTADEKRDHSLKMVEARKKKKAERLTGI